MSKYLHGLNVILAFNYRYINPQIAKNKLFNISKTLKKWADNNKAIFAPSKSKVLAVRNLYNHTSLLTCITLIGQIKGVTSLNILGVTFNEALPLFLMLQCSPIKSPKQFSHLGMQPDTTGKSQINTSCRYLWEQSSPSFSMLHPHG